MPRDCDCRSPWEKALITSPSWLCREISSFVHQVAKWFGSRPFWPLTGVKRFACLMIGEGNPFFGLGQSFQRICGENDALVRSVGR